MLTIRINKKRYKVPYDWKDITLREAIRLHGIIAEHIPPSLSKIYHAMRLRETDDIVKMQEGLTDKEALKDIPAFYGKVIEELGGVPKGVVDFVDPVARTGFYTTHLEKFVTGLIFMMPEEFIPEGITSFTIKGQRYIVPPIGKKADGEPLFGVDLTAKEFAHSADLLIAIRNVSRTQWDAVPLLLGILCRPEGDVYNEQEAIDRGEVFMDLTMDIVWEVVMYILAIMIDVKKLHPSLGDSDFKARIAAKKSGLDQFGWYGSLLGVAREIGMEESVNMNMWDFLDVLSFRAAENRYQKELSELQKEA